MLGKRWTLGAGPPRARLVYLVFTYPAETCGRPGSFGQAHQLANMSQKHKPQRWVVERTHSWLSKCRAILVRYNKNSSSYLRLIQLTCDLLEYRRLNRLKAAPGFEIVSK